MEFYATVLKAGSSDSCPQYLNNRSVLMCMCELCALMCEPCVCYCVGCGCVVVGAVWVRELGVCELC